MCQWPPAPPFAGSHARSPDTPAALPRRPCSPTGKHQPGAPWTGVIPGGGWGWGSMRGGMTGTSWPRRQLFANLSTGGEQAPAPPGLRTAPSPSALRSPWGPHFHVKVSASTKKRMARRGNTLSSLKSRDKSPMPICSNFQGLKRGEWEKNQKTH